MNSLHACTANLNTANLDLNLLADIFNQRGMTQLLIMSAYMLLLLLLGVGATRLSRGTKDDFMLASHSIGPFLLLLTMFGTTMTAFALLGSSGEAYKEGIGVYGMMASSSGIIHSLCFFIIGVKIYQHGRRYKYTTQIQFFRDRLQSETIGWVLFPVIVGLIIPYLLIGVMGGGSAVQSMTAGAFPEMFEVLKPDGSVDMSKSGGIPPWLGSLVICIVVLIYVFFGGMRGTTWVNSFQTFVFMALGLATFMLLAKALGKQDSLIENLRLISEKVPVDKATRVEMSQTKFFTYLLIPLSVGMFPHLFQHWLTAKSVNTFKLPVVLHPIFIMIVWVPCVLIGIWATTKGLIPPKPPLPSNPNVILPFLVNRLTNPVLSGLLGAGILAAIMSSLDSQFLCIGSIFTTDIADRKGKMSDSKQIWVARSFIIAIVGTTYVLSLLGRPSVFALAVWCFSGYAALFPLVFLSLYWKRFTAAGAICGVLAMAATWGFYFNAAGFGSDRSFKIYLFPAEKSWEIMPVVPIFVACLVVSVVVSYLTPAPDEKHLRRFFD